MGTVRFVALGRFARQRRSLVVVGILLGLVFGVALAAFAAARRTASAYDRVLAEADAPDAAVALGGLPDDPDQALTSFDEIVDARVYAGFLGAADGVDRALTTALLAPIDDRFPLERPDLERGRFPRPDAADEAIVSTDTAGRGNFEVGQELRFRFFDPATSSTAVVDIEIVGIGTFPAEIVADETNVLGVFVFTRAFFDAHRELTVYAVANVDLAPGTDARRDLAPRLRPLGYELQSVRTQERDTVGDALRPAVIVLIAIGLLAFGAASVATSQVVVRVRDRWQTDDRRLRTLGATRREIRGVELFTAGAVTLVALLTAFAVMVAASPLAPIGPLHAHDPGQGVVVDTTVAAVGALAIVVAIGLLTITLSSVRSRALRPAVRRAPWFTALPGNPATTAGITLALRSDDGRHRSWRTVVATTIAAAGVAFSAAFVVSAVVLTDTPARYGLDADLIALNAYGDQSDAALLQAFGSRPDVRAATGYTAGSFLVDGRAVPGIAATPIRGELSPSILRGRPPLADDEIALGRDTLDAIGADLGDEVPVQLLATVSVQPQAARPSKPLRIVGVATFPPVSQVGTDMPRLGVGALMPRAAFLRLGGAPENQPEFTMVRLASGTEPQAVIDANADGFDDPARSATTWFEDAKPAELRQLDAAGNYLRAALLVSTVILLGVFVHALWIRVRANRRDLAVLRVVGCTRRQLDAISTWQTAPFLVVAIVVGLPIGFVAGTTAFRAFARSLGVDDTASLPPTLIVALVAVVLVSGAVGGLVAVAAARRVHTPVVLREL